MIMFSPTLGRDYDLSDFFCTDWEHEAILTDYNLYYNDMAPGIRRAVESFLRYS